MTEAQLCILLEEYFRDWEIYKEVPAAGGRLDMYIRKSPLWVAVEVKMQLSPKLIMQAHRNIPHSHYSYIAIPFLKSCYDGMEICRKLGIGVLEYRNDRWAERIKPKFRRRISPYRVLESMKHAVAGVQHNSHSEFKITLELICHFLARNGGKYPIRDLFKDNKYHYANSKSALQSIKKYCEAGSIKEFGIEQGFFVLKNYQQNHSK